MTPARARTRTTRSGVERTNHETTHKGHEKMGNDHHLRRLSIVKQILLISSIRNVQRTVWRICIMMLGFKRVKANIRSECYFCVFRYCLFLIRYCTKCPFRFSLQQSANIYFVETTLSFWSPKGEMFSMLDTST